MNEWQPIETAPRDGTLILGYAKADFPAHRVAPMLWNKKRKCWETNTRQWEPQYWMPVPVPRGVNA